MSFWKPGSDGPTMEPVGDNDNARNHSVLLEQQVQSKSPAHSKPQLSKALLGMKFMKQKQKTDEVLAQERERIQRLQYKLPTDLPNTETAMNIDGQNEDGCVLMCVEEDVDLYSALPGRRSFNGFNKAVEKHYRELMDEDYINDNFNFTNKKLSSGLGETISDVEMLARYEKLVGLPRGPNQGLRKEVSIDRNRPVGSSGRARNSMGGGSGRYYSNCAQSKLAKMRPADGAATQKQRASFPPSSRAEASPQSLAQVQSFGGGRSKSARKPQQQKQQKHQVVVNPYKRKGFTENSHSKKAKR